MPGIELGVDNAILAESCALPLTELTSVKLNDQIVVDLLDFSHLLYLPFVSAGSPAFQSLAELLAGRRPHGNNSHSLAALVDDDHLSVRLLPNDKPVLRV